MKSASISYRVADFLKQHPPFQFASEEELIELAMSGRVKFHEADELVYRKGAPRKGQLFVIQQGRVQLLDDDEGEERLVDLLGVGDMLGIGHFLEEPGYLYTARTASDVILYAIESASFDALAAKHPEISRYLAAYFSVNPHYQLPGGAVRGASKRTAPSAWTAGAAAATERAKHNLVCCDASATIREAARAMSASATGAIAVVDSQSRPVGWLDDAVLRERVTAGPVPVSAPVSAVMRRPLPVAAPGRMPGSYLLEMLRSEGGLVGITADGTASSPLVGLVTENDLTLYCGDNPTDVARGIASATGYAELARVYERGDALIRADLGRADTIEWNALVATAYRRASFRKVVELAELELRSEGREASTLASCWLCFGASGRGEQFSSAAVEHGLVYADPDESDREPSADWFTALARKVASGLSACGFGTSPRGLAASNPAWCLPLAEWRELYSGWIEDPIIHRIYERTALFDLRTVCGDDALAERLCAHAVESIAASPGFLPILANDSMANLPPLTFFEGLVVDDDGARSETLDLERSALHPLIDVGRVFALADGRLGFESTFERLSAASTREDRGALFRDGLEGFRIALRHHTLAALRNPDGSGGIVPATLTKYDQQLLKATFRSILSLLEFTAEHFGLVPRR